MVSTSIVCIVLCLVLHIDGSLGLSTKRQVGTTPSSSTARLFSTSAKHVPSTTSGVLSDIRQIIFMFIIKANE